MFLIIFFATFFKYMFLIKNKNSFMNPQREFVIFACGACIKNYKRNRTAEQWNKFGLTCLYMALKICLPNSFMD